jgi:hypothetical protein
VAFQRTFSFETIAGKRARTTLNIQAKQLADKKRQLLKPRLLLCFSPYAKADRPQ